MDTQDKIIELNRLARLLRSATTAADLVAIRVYSKRIAVVAKQLKDAEMAR